MGDVKPGQEPSTTKTTTTTTPLGETSTASRPSPAGPYLPTLRLVAKITPCLSHRSMDVRVAGVKALEQVFNGVKRWEETVKLDWGGLREEQVAEEMRGDWVDVEAMMREMKKKPVVPGPSLTGTKRARSSAIGSSSRLGSGSSTPVGVGRKRPKVEDRHAVLDGLSIPRDLVDDEEQEQDEEDEELDDQGVGEVVVPVPRKRVRLGSPAGRSREGTPVKKVAGRLSKVKKELGVPVPTSAAPTASMGSTSNVALTSATTATMTTALDMPVAEPTEEQILAGLSSRQAILLKRKIRGGMSKAEAMMESMRLQGTGTPVEETPAPEVPVVLAESQEKPGKAPKKSGGKGKDKVKEETIAVKVEDEAMVKKATPVPVVAPMVAPVIAPGGPVEASRATSNDLDEIMPRTLDEWVWTRLVKKLEGMLESESWEARHGSALALRDLIRIQGGACGLDRGRSPADNVESHQAALKRIAKTLILVLVRDRFGDFVGDSVMAPVRESAAQALASVISHMPASMLIPVGKTLLSMVTQSWVDVPYVWELRHAGLLGLRYMLAVVKDQGVVGDEKRGLGLHEVLSATMIGLADSDDDVRSVSATCLLPILPLLAESLGTDDIAGLLDTLWNCFSVDGDDLGSSTSAVMDLLCRILGFPKVVKMYSKDHGQSRSLSALVPRLYPYFRHTIGPVRLAVVRTIQAFLSDTDLPNDWINADILHLLYKNLIVEDRIDCRTESLTAWDSALRVISTRPDFLSEDVLPNVASWLNIALVPIDMPLQDHLFHEVTLRGSTAGHNVDKSTLGADLALVSPETILRNRIDAIIALAEVTRYDVAAATHQTLLGGYLASTSAHQVSLCGILIEEWTRVRDEDFTSDLGTRLEVALPSVEPLVVLLERLVEAGPTAELYEVQTSLQAIRQEAKMLATLIDRQSKVSVDEKLRTDWYDRLSLEQVQDLLETGFAASIERLPSSKQKLARAAIKDRWATLTTAISRHRLQREQLEIQVKATAAAALIGMRFVPAKMNPLMKGIMSGVKVSVT